MSVANSNPRPRYDALVLDDDVDVASMLQDALESIQGWTCLTLNSYEALLHRREAALSTRVAIVDINLGYGQTDGLAAFRWLREQDYPHPVVFLTGFDENHPAVAEVQEACRQGRARLVTKPVDVDELCAILSRTRP